MLENIINGVIFPIIVAIVSLFIIRFLENKFKKISCKDHQIFHRLKSVKSINVNINFKLDNKAKEIIFKSILTGQIDCILNEAESIAKDVNQNLVDNMKDRLEDAVTVIFSNLYSFYESDASLSEVDKNTIRVVMDKFYKINKERIDRLYSEINTIDNSIFYKTNDEKACCFFDLIITVVLDQLSLSEHTFNSVNGDLKGMSFKGVVVK